MSMHHDISLKKKEVKDVLARLSHDISGIDFNERNLVIWGAGNTANLCQESFKRHCVCPKYYIDNDKRKQSSLFHGHKVISPDSDDFKKIEDPVVLISSANVDFTNEIRSELNRMGLRNFTVDEYFFGKNADRLIKIIGVLSDDGSVQVYCDMILNRLKNRLPSDDTISEDQYFILPNFREVGVGDVFVNIGAYLGEEVGRYLECCDGKLFGKIISFEPDSDNYAEMMTHVEDLKRKWNVEEGRIQSVMAAVGDVTKTSFFGSRQGIGTYIDETATDSGPSIEIYSLDDFMPDGRIDLLKADIESFELNMLHGAEKLLIRNAPKIAISIYHSPADFFDIIEYLLSLNLGYKFSVRHHSKLFEDTVLYAYTN